MKKSRFGWFMIREAREGAICITQLCEAMNTAGVTANIFSPVIGDDIGRLVGFVSDPEDWNKSSWWQEKAINVAMFYAPMSIPIETLRAAKSAGTVVVLECDSDGYVVAWQNLVRAFRIRLDPSLTLRHQLGSLKAMLNELFQSKARANRFIQACSLADFIKIESDGPAENLKQFFRLYSRDDLAAKLVVIPFAVRRHWTETLVPQVREDLIICAGRHSDLQKNPCGLANVLDRARRLLPEFRFEIHTRGEIPNVLSRLASKEIVHFQDTSSSELAKRFRCAKIQLSVAKWETTPIIGLEALCSGCTIVAPTSVAGYRSLVGCKGEFGSLFSHTSNASRALVNEVKSWGQGLRNPLEIASRWRDFASCQQVANSILERTGVFQRRTSELDSDQNSSSDELEAKEA